MVLPETGNLKENWFLSGNRVSDLSDIVLNGMMREAWCHAAGSDKPEETVGTL